MPNLVAVDLTGIIAESPLAELLRDRVDRILTSWRKLDPDAEPPAAALDRFLSALKALEQATDALATGQAGEAPSAAPTWQELDAARSYSHLAGLLPRSLERVVAFDAAAGVVRRDGGGGGGGSISEQAGVGGGAP